MEPIEKKRKTTIDDESETLEGDIPNQQLIQSESVDVEIDSLMSLPDYQFLQTECRDVEIDTLLALPDSELFQTESLDVELDTQTPIENKTMEKSPKDEKQTYQEPIENKTMEKPPEDAKQTYQKGEKNKALLQVPNVKKVIIPQMAVDDIMNRSDPKKVNELIKYLMSVLITQYEKNGKKPISYYRFIVDTSDYEKTMNNMFNTSIIINRGLAQLDIDEQDRAFLYPLEKGQVQLEAENTEKIKSLINYVTYEQWVKFRDAANGCEGYLQEAYKQKLDA